MTNNENEGKSKNNIRIVVSGSNSPVLFPPESLKSLLATSSAIQQILEQNERFFRQFSKTIEAQENFLKFSNLPLAFEETNAVSKAIERMLSLETSKISRMFEEVIYQSEAWKE